MSATRERSRQAFKMLEWRLIERAHPHGIKKRRRTLIAALPHASARSSWTASSLGIHNFSITSHDFSTILPS